MLFGKTGSGAQVSSVSPGIVFEGPYLCLAALSPLHLLVEATLSTSLHLVSSRVDAVLLLCRAHPSWSIPNVFLMIQTGGGESKKVSSALHHVLDTLGHFSLDYLASSGFAQVSPLLCICMVLFLCAALVSVSVCSVHISAKGCA